MLDKLNIDSNLSKDKKIKIVLEYAQEICDDVFKNRFNSSKLSNYVYSIVEAENELGLDEELITQLIEDYITQIFKANDKFKNLISSIYEKDGVDKNTKLNELHDLAHKNYGVVRNLHIKDAQILLNDLMSKHDDLNHLKDCVKALQACAYKLNPEYAFNTLSLIKLKKTL